MAARMKTAISQSRQRTPPIGRLRRLVCDNGFRANTFAGIDLRGNFAMQEDVKVKIDQVIEAHSAPAQQVFNKGSKTRAQSKRIRATHQSEGLKSVFLDAIAHDFKTPLTSIKASVTGLLDDLETNREQRKKLLTIIDEECDRINRLVSEASEIARLESGAVKLDSMSCSAEGLISAALADCRCAMSRREIRLDVKHRNSRLLVDFSLAKRMLVHLITNAQLYSSPGQPIRITTQKQNKFYSFSIADQGPGIEAEEIGQIFDKFYRGKSNRHQVQSTGMGLPIAKTIVETLGGSISATSRVGQGSVFTFTLPVDLP